MVNVVIISTVMVTGMSQYHLLWWNSWCVLSVVYIFHLYLVADFLLQYLDGSALCNILSEMIVCECPHMAKFTPKSYMCYHVVFSPVRMNDPFYAGIIPQ